MQFAAPPERLVLLSNIERVTRGALCFACEETWGGAGVAPMLSMPRHMAEFGDSRDCRLFFGVNTQEELLALDSTGELTKALPESFER